MKKKVHNKKYLWRKLSPEDEFIAKILFIERDSVYYKVVYLINTKSKHIKVGDERWFNLEAEEKENKSINYEFLTKKELPLFII